METRTIYCLMRGGDGFGLGALDAGMVSLGGVEYDPEIAACADRNIPGPATTVDDVRNCHWTHLRGRVYLLHMSPVCTHASMANPARGETEDDITMAAACIRAIREIQAPVVTLENVWGYRNFQAYKNILAALHEEGYRVEFWHLNSADYGVPQTRKRLIMMASRVYDPRPPVQTHADPKKKTHWPSWNGWYAAIEDLVPSLSDSQFAPWQLERLPRAIERLAERDPEFASFLVHGTGMRAMPTRSGAEPAPVVMANASGNGNRPRACVLVDGKNAHGATRPLPSEGACSPAHTIGASYTPQHTRALVVDCQNGSAGAVEQVRGLTAYLDTTPIFAASASQAKRPARALVIDDQNNGAVDRVTGTRGQTARADGSPIYTVSATLTGRSRALLLEGGNARAVDAGGLGIRLDTAPSFTLAAGKSVSGGADSRATLLLSVNGIVYPCRVVSMTPRALARLQTFPDWYVFPERATLATRIIGGAVPPLLARAVILANLHP